jgi:hypothetical protein
VLVSALRLPEATERAGRLGEPGLRLRQAQGGAHRDDAGEPVLVMADGKPLRMARSRMEVWRTVACILQLIISASTLAAVLLLR